jgi:sulfur-carrier protein adenylyltransferase/sulfurtransferase
MAEREMAERASGAAMGIGGAAGSHPLTGVRAPLTSDDALRYGRQILLPELGIEGQERLKGARVLVVGAGGLGSPAALYLAAAGVGTLGLVDFDRVDSTNLHRQLLHGTSDVGRPKLESAVDRLREVNPGVRVVPHELRLTSANALDVLSGYDLVVDGSDNFPTRYLVNDACVLLGIPDVYGAIHRFEGQVSVFHGRTGPCYRCLFREPPPPGLVPSCAEAGVLGVLPGIVGSLQAMEAIKLILGIGETLVGRLQIFEGLTLEWRELRLRKNPECPVCAPNPVQTELIDYERFCGLTPEADDRWAPPPVITPRELAARIEAAGGVAPFTLVDVREAHEWERASLEPQGARHIALGSLPGVMSLLDPEDEIVVYCRTGGRAGRAQALLKEAGFSRVLNLEGGIVAWRRDVDPAMPES